MILNAEYVKKLLYINGNSWIIEKHNMKPQLQSVKTIQKESVNFLLHDAGGDMLRNKRRTIFNALYVVKILKAEVKSWYTGRRNILKL